MLACRWPRVGAWPSALVSWTTPPEELPCSAENGPRMTSMRSAPAITTCETWPWPSGMVAGMPSAYRRRPRTPKVERAPKPRIDSWVSWAKFCRSRAARPGTPARASASATPWPAASPSSAIVVTEAGTSNAGTSRSRAVVTWRRSSVTASAASSAAASAGRANATASAQARRRRGRTGRRTLIGAGAGIGGMHRNLRGARSAGAGRSSWSRMGKDFHRNRLFHGRSADRGHRAGHVVEVAGAQRRHADPAGADGVDAVLVAQPVDLRARQARVREHPRLALDEVVLRRPVRGQALDQARAQGVDARAHLPELLFPLRAQRRIVEHAGHQRRAVGGGAGVVGAHQALDLRLHPARLVGAVGDHGQRAHALAIERERLGVRTGDHEVADRRGGQQAHRVRVLLDPA